MVASANPPPARKTRIRVPWGSLGILSWILGPVLWPFFLLAGLWSVRRSLFPVRGRVTRWQYWNALMLYLCAGGLLAAIIAGMSQETKAPKVVVFALYGALAVLIALSATMTALGRLRDRNVPHWWLLLYYGLPAVLIVACSVSVFPDVVRLMLGVAVFYLLIWTVVALGIRRGTPGPNPYGPDMVALGRERARLRRQKTATVPAAASMSRPQTTSGDANLTRTP